MSAKITSMLVCLSFIASGFLLIPSTFFFPNHVLGSIHSHVGTNHFEEARSR